MAQGATVRNRQVVPQVHRRPSIGQPARHPEGELNRCTRWRFDTPKITVLASRP